ncbi:hypothetical protein HOY82DRAFT_544165 [Tuber indicum]|nr:hypothetical protein HOY82DRAFT_544165 [Tuber indicum]
MDKYTTGIYPLNGQKILKTLPGYDSYQPTETISQTPSLTPTYEPKTPKNESEIIELATFAEKNIYRNTPQSRKARAAVRSLAHSASLHCSTLNLQQETERKRRQYLIEEGINSGNKGKRRIKVDNSAVSAGDVKKIIQANYSEIGNKIKQQYERENNPEGGGGKRYKSTVQLGGEQRKLKEKMERYRKLVTEKENAYERLKSEERNALEGLDGLDIEYEEDDERGKHHENGSDIGVEVDGGDSC